MSTTIGARLNDMHRAIVALHGQIELLKVIDGDGHPYLHETEIIESAQDALSALYHEWYWLHHNAASFGAIPAPNDDERDALAAARSGGPQ